MSGSLRPALPRRTHQPLSLERQRVQFLPLTWTVVHPIDEQSPLAGKSAADLRRLQAEVLILIRGFDQAFSQTVHARCSYRCDELVRNGRFAPAFSVGPEGDLILDSDKVSALVSPEMTTAGA